MRRVTDTQVGNDGMRRCWWCGQHDQYMRYHDQEWGMPVAEDRRLFEKLSLEGFQSGLSWLTILRKRDAFRSAFCDFDFRRIARFTPKRVDRLVEDAGIVRHRGKIASVVNNANRTVELVDQEGSLAALIWKYEPSRQVVIRRRDQIVPKTAESIALSKELKRRGWSYVGPTTCYAMMQAVGIVNDHLRRCDAWERVACAREAFRRPGSGS